MFCFNCGTKVDGGTRFCPECGVRLVEESVPSPGVPEASPAPAEAQCAGTPSAAEEKAAAKKRGFIFTNVCQLAQKFGVPVEDVSGALNDFIREKKRFGVFYELLDVGDYAFRCSSRRVSLTAQNDIVDFLDVLLDAHNAEVRRGEPETTYLFIIGGHDTIPMPKGPYFADCRDKDSDADLLFSFPYGREAVSALHSGKIFAYDALFYVARLPFGTDSGFSALTNYLRNALRADAGEFSIGEMYAQCDPHWKHQSSAVISIPREVGLFPQYSQELPEEIYYRKLFLTPPICEESQTTKAVFNTAAMLFYFNLHGSDAPQAPGYVGESLNPGGEYYEGISPSYFLETKRLNAIVTEACYGGRFIGYPTSGSMVLSALSANTVCFLGSSRIAWGGGGGTCEPPLSAITSADFLSATFILCLLGAKHDAGGALFEARKCFFAKGRTLSLMDYTTLVEFNLFGDPTLSVSAGTSAGGKSAVYGERLQREAEKSFAAVPNANCAGDRSVSGKSAKIGFMKQSVPADGTDLSSMSLLERVRSQVNANLKQIRESVNKHLYDNYGVKPRELSSIFRIKYEDGREEMNFNYAMNKIGETEPIVAVQTDLGGNVKSVHMSK